ncbi:MAG: hypothetical protein SVW02_00775, partial [Candidatus Nanohaloarchaea archaeon]|nr:hypothetical protein [Candidatus Nanohaloarchaea archaeon]
MTLRDEVVGLVEEMDRDVDAAIVEGSNDQEALEKAGFTGAIYTCSENTNGVVSLARTVSRENTAVSILTDYDSEGSDLCGKLRDAIPDGQLHGIWRKK